MSENIDSTYHGKKIFFLHPSVVVQNHVISELVQEEFEVYSTKNELKLKQVLRKYPDSIVFASINERMKDDTWESWIRGIMGDDVTSDVSIGIIASTENEDDRQKYAELFKVRCGYTVIKSDIAHFNKQLVALLNSVDAKGRRKFIRLLTEGETNTTVNIPIDGNFVNGYIKDISVIGFSCSFPDDPDLTKNKLFTDIQIRLHSQLLNVEGIAYGSRMDKHEKIYVMLFTQRVKSDTRSKIRKFINSVLQARMDFDLK